jgi:prefoldin subunit 5
VLPHSVYASSPSLSTKELSPTIELKDKQIRELSAQIGGLERELNEIRAVSDTGL